MAPHNKEFFNFIKKFSDSDPNKLRLGLKGKEFDFDTEEAINQIECRKKYSSKLKFFLSNPFFLFPDSISGEQSSHQAVAKYHSSLAKKNCNVLDLTAGLGIDALSFALKGCNVTAVEIDPNKAEFLKENARNFNIPDFKILNNDSISWLEKINTPDENNSDSFIKTFDLIFIDPSRRDVTNNKRVYNLKDCLPDVIKYQSLLSRKANKILIKTSPLLDINQTIKDIDNITSIKAIGVKGECKELLLEIDKTRLADVTLEAIDLDNEGNIISEFKVRSDDKKSDVEIASIEDLKESSYILEPSAMLMKLSPWSAVNERFQAKKFGKSSHIFVSNEKPDNFPGRVTEIIRLITKKDRKSIIGLPASVVSRNHPLSSEELRKYFHLKEGDRYFLYASRLREKPIFLLTKHC